MKSAPADGGQVCGAIVNGKEGGRGDGMSKDDNNEDDREACIRGEHGEEKKRHGSRNRFG